MSRVGILGNLKYFLVSQDLNDYRSPSCSSLNPALLVLFAIRFIALFFCSPFVVSIASYWWEPTTFRVPLRHSARLPLFPFDFINLLTSCPSSLLGLHWSLLNLFLLFLLNFWFTYFFLRFSFHVPLVFWFRILFLQKHKIMFFLLF